MKKCIAIYLKILDSTTDFLSLSLPLSLFSCHNKKNVSWAGNQHIKMISEGSCDTEDWSNDC